MSTALRITSGMFCRVALLDMDCSVVWHAHPHSHVLLKIEGDDAQFTVSRQVVPLTDRLAVLVNAWEPHSYDHDPTRRSTLILALYVEPRWLGFFRPNWIASGAPGFFERSSVEVSKEIAVPARALAAEMIHGPDPPSRQEELLSKLMISVIECFTPWRTIDRPLRDLAKVWSPDHRVRRAIDLMRTDPGNAPSVSELAKAAGLSRAHFFRLFEKATGVTPHVFLNVLKIESAVKVVGSSDESLAEIGVRLRFDSPAHFSRFFRDRVSIAPSAFRSAMRQWSITLL
jgi:AraC-like DNA-binding protein